MSALSQLKRQVVAHLQTDPGFSLATLCAEYPGLRETLKKPTIAVRVGKMEIKQQAFGGVVGMDEQGEPVQGALAEVALQFDMYLPRTMDATKLFEWYETLCEMLVLSGTVPAAFYSMTCGDVDYDARLAAVHLRASAQTQILVSIRGEFLPVREIQVQRSGMIDQ
jgi:hypothetical protein